MSWHDAQEFIRRLNAKEGHKRYRLPTEAEWEYAARAGTTTACFFGDCDYDALDEYGWCVRDSDDEYSTSPVGRLRPNPWGLYDMYGNVLEWVSDWYGEKYPSAKAVVDPKGPSSGKYRVMRGGSFQIGHGEMECRSNSRYGQVPHAGDDRTGFRLVMTAE